MPANELELATGVEAHRDVPVPPSPQGMALAVVEVEEGGICMVLNHAVAPISNPEALNANASNSPVDPNAVVDILIAYCCRCRRKRNREWKFKSGKAGTISGAGHRKSTPCS